MIKVYQKYLILSFLKTFMVVFSIFFSLTIILNVFEEVSYLFQIVFEKNLIEN